MTDSIEKQVRGKDTRNNQWTGRLKREAGRKAKRHWKKMIHRMIRHIYKRDLYHEESDSQE